MEFESRKEILERRKEIEVSQERFLRNCTDVEPLIIHD